jgi:hypothetical protein
MKSTRGLYHDSHKAIGNKALYKMLSWPILLENNVKYRVTPGPYPRSDLELGSLHVAFLLFFEGSSGNLLRLIAEMAN